MQRSAGRSRRADPFHEAGRSLIRGPDRAGALVFGLMLGSLSVIPGCAILYLVSSFSGPTDFTGESSVYFEFAISSFVLAAISFVWLRMRRGGIDWLDKRAGDDRS